MSISSLAKVSPKANIGKNVTIDDFATIHNDVTIGDNAHIHSSAIIYPDTTIGHDSKIYPGALIGIESQDLKYNGEKAQTKIGNYTVIREYATIHKGTAASMITSVGDNCLIMGYAHVAHDCVVGNHVILANYTGLAGHVTVQDYAIIEGHSGVQQFVTIGAHTFLAAYSKVRQNVPPFIKVAQDPLQYIGVNSVGLARRGVDAAVIKTIEDIYRILFVLKMPYQERIQNITNNFPDSEAKGAILKFIEMSINGIVKGI